MKASTRFAAVACWLVAAAAAGSVPVGGVRAVEDREPHETIEIMADAQVVLPDALSGNGVRSGTGTSSDPFRISGWEIDASAAAGIRIADVTLFVLVENVTIRGNALQPGLVVERSPNIALASVTVEGTRHGLVSVNSGAEIRASTFRDIQGTDDGPPYESHAAIVATTSRIVVEDTRIERVTSGIGALNADLTVRRTDLLQVERGITSQGTVADLAGALTLDDVHLVGSTDPFDPCEAGAMANPPRPGVFVDPHHVSKAAVSGVDIRNFDVGVWAQWSFETTPAPAPVEISSSVLAANVQGVSFSAGGASLRVTDSTLRANGVGILAALTLGHQANALSVADNLVEANGEGIQLYHEPAPEGADLPPPPSGGAEPPEVHVRGNDIVENCSHGLRYDPTNAPASLQGYEVPAQDNYWGLSAPRRGDGSNDVSDGILVDPVAGQPFTDYQPSGPGAPSNAVVAPILALAAMVLTRRRGT